MMKLIAVVVLLFGTCAFAPSGTEPFTPPESYRAQYDSAQACSGVKGNFDQVHWYLIPGHDFPCPSGRCIGQWNPPHDIYIAEVWKNIGWVVRHEAVHEITGWRHDGDEKGPGKRDIQVWGVQCHATWGYLDNDPNYKP
jgi:hypothetical protein